MHNRNEQHEAYIHTLFDNIDTTGGRISPYGHVLAGTNGTNTRKGMKSMTIDDKLNMNSMQLRKVMISAHKTMLEARHEGRDTFRAVRTMNSISEIIDKLLMKIMKSKTVQNRK